MEALKSMEKGLVLRQHFFGSESEEVWNSASSAGEMCNLIAMNLLQENEFERTEGMLRKAEILGERDLRLQATTANNLACLYRKQGKLHAALQYLQKALKIEARLEGVTTAADTHLNTCAVLSQMNRHASALQHAQSGLILLQEELFGGDGDQEPAADRVAVMAICYHNIGVEHEFSGKYDRALQAYRKGVSVAETHLGTDHTVAQTLKRSLRAAKKVADAKGTRKGPREKKTPNFVSQNRSQTRFTPTKNNALAQSQQGNAYRTNQGSMLRSNDSDLSLPPLKGAMSQSASSPMLDSSGPRPVSRKDKERFNKVNDAYGKPPGVNPPGTCSPASSPKSLNASGLGGMGLDEIPTPRLGDEDTGSNSNNPESDSDVGVQIFKKGASVSSDGGTHTFYLVSIFEFKSPRRVAVSLHNPRGGPKVSAEFGEHEAGDVMELSLIFGAETEDKWSKASGLVTVLRVDGGKIVFK
jgi:tetratricopeptide (TPR) repeat protein